MRPACLPRRRACLTLLLPLCARTGTSLEDGAQVIAKLATNKSAAAIVLEREMHILGRLSESLESSGTTMRVVD